MVQSRGKVEIGLECSRNASVSNLEVALGVKYEGNCLGDDATGE